MITYIENEIDKTNLKLLVEITNVFYTSYSKILKSKKYIFLLNWIFAKTKFLNNSSILLKTRIYWILNNILEFPICQNCGKLLININVHSLTIGYKTMACCKKCLYEIAMKKSKETCLKKYGVEYSFQSTNNKEKSKLTCLKKYGAEFSTQNKTIRAKSVKTRMENTNGKYISDESLEKRRLTALKKYGTDCFLKTEQYLQKTKETCLKKYGVEHPSLSEQAKNQHKATCLERYGVDSFSKTTLFKNKLEDTILKRYGIKNVFCHGSKFRDIAEQTRLEKYGDKNYNNREKAELTCKERYGGLLFDVYRKENTIKYMTANYNKLLDNKYVIPLFSLDDYINKTANTIFKWKCLECGNEFKAQINWNTRYCCDNDTIVLGRCLSCHPILSNGTSKEELQFISEIKNIYTGTIVERSNILKTGESKKYWLEIDCYLPDLKIGFEYDGIYYHLLSSNFDMSSKHLLKTTLAENNGIKLIHVRSDKWLNDKQYYLNLYKNIINNDVDFSKIYDLSQDIIEVDRSIFNKCFSIPNYRLIGEKLPEIINIVTANRTYIYKECGKLVYKKCHC